MDFISDYLKFIIYSIIGLIFSFTSFFLLLNIYHYFEIRKEYDINISSYPLYVSIYDNTNAINTSIDKIDNMSIRNGLKNCLNYINYDIIDGLKDKKKINIVDVYGLTKAYDSNIVNECLNHSLISLKKENNEIINNYYLILSSSNYYLKKDLLNNSSYFYNTQVANNKIKNAVKDGFDEVMNSYNNLTNFLIYVTNFYKKGV